ncbi:MAG: WG repeat-containing protein [Oscillospiraceae bacterium]|nr:WG repeat-containing protein [Oscillospiraceae bacterium]
MQAQTTYAVKTLVEPILEYEYICYFSEGLALVRNNFTERKVGFIDKTGKLVIPMNYEDETLRHRNAGYGMPPVFREGLMNLCKDGKYGFVDMKGNIVIPFDYDYAYGFLEGLAAVEKDGKWGFIGKAGKTILPMEYDAVSGGFFDGLAPVKKNGKWGFIDKTGTAVIPIELEYDHVGPFFGEYATAANHNGGHPGFYWIDKTGKAEKAPPFEEHDCRKGLVPMERDGKWGLEDRAAGDEGAPLTVLPFEYESVMLAYDEAVTDEWLMTVRQNGKWGIVEITKI